MKKLKSSDFSEKDKDRFWSKVDAQGKNDCWEWTGYKVNGYGRIKRSGKCYLTHRIAWILKNGQIPNGKLICHKCDTPACVNTKHLFLGTHKDNARDRLRKGRNNHVFGEDHFCSLLTKLDVLEIRNLCSSGELHRVVAKQFGVARQTITSIISRKSWAHI